MRTNILLGLLIASLVSGCFSSVKTRELALDPQPVKNIAIGLDAINIDTSEAAPYIAGVPFGTSYANYKNDMYAMLVSESKGVISAKADQPYRMFVSLKFKANYDPPSAAFATLTLFLFPLGFIPVSDSQSYSVNYVIQDQENNIVHQQTIPGTVEGTFQGVYLGRVNAYSDLLAKEAETVAKNAARHIIKDVNDNSGRIVAAARATSGVSTGVLLKTTGAMVMSDIDDLPPTRLKGRRNAYAIVIGIEQYRQKLPKADYAVHDAQTVTEYLTKVLGYPEENVVTLINEQASKGDFVKYFEKWLGNNVEQGSSVFVYYSGHGAPDPKTSSAYLVPYDGDPSFIDETGYSLKRMYDVLSKLPAKDVVVALDSCFSGSGGRSVIAKGARPLVMNLRNAVPPSKNMSVLSAASGDQMSSTYDDKGHGLFTYFMLKGIKNEDVTRPDGSIKLDDLFSYIKPQVERIARKQYNNEQTPQLIEPKR